MELFLTKISSNRKFISKLYGSISRKGWNIKRKIEGTFQHKSSTILKHYFRLEIHSEGSFLKFMASYLGKAWRTKRKIGGTFQQKSSTINWNRFRQKIRRRSYRSTAQRRFSYKFGRSKARNVKLTAHFSTIRWTYFQPKILSGWGAGGETSEMYQFLWSIFNLQGKV